jgi:hypothetical protein
MQADHQNKRVVSKSRYAGIMGGRILGGAAAMSFIALGVLGMVAALMCLVLAFTSRNMALAIGMGVTLFFFFFLFVWLGVYGLSLVVTDDDILPLTRHTAKTVADEDSLMRASSAQDIPADTTLLRPMQNGSDPMPETLLRSPSE